MASVYLPAGKTIWMMVIRPPGAKKPLRKSSGETGQRKAQQKANDLEAGARKGAPIEVGKVTLEQGAELVREDYRDKNRRSLDKFEGIYTNHLVPYFGERTKLATIRTPEIKAYRSHRRSQTQPNGKPYANGTINREVGFLYRMFTLAAKAELLVYRPAGLDKLAEATPRKGFLESDQFRAICDRLDGRGEVAAVYEDIATVAYVTGWRVDSEILPQEWRHVDLKARELRLDPEMAKNGDGRVFPMTDELYDVYVRRDQVRKDLAKAGILCCDVFVRLVATARGGAAKASPKKPKRITDFYRPWKRAATRAGYPAAIPHDTRRTSIRTLSRRGVSEQHGMAASGHKTPSIYRRYNIVSAADLAAIRDKIEDIVPQRKQEAGT